LRKQFGLLRAFEWDSKGSLLLQLSDILLGITQSDSDGSLDALNSTASEIKKRKKDILEHARSIVNQKAKLGKINAVFELDEYNKVTYRLLNNDLIR